MTTNKLLLSLVMAVLFLSGCQKKSENLIQFVDPMIGTGPTTDPERVEKHQSSEIWGLAIPAVSAPFGMTQWTPQTRDGENKGISPYYYGGTSIQGFRGSHWAGSVNARDFGSFTIMPMNGYLRTFVEDRGSEFEHDNITSSPASFSCLLLRYMILAEMTGTARTGFFRFSFATNDPAYILITPNSDEGQGFIKVDPEKHEIYGYNPVHPANQVSGQQASFNGYFVVRFNRPFDDFGCTFQMEKHEKELEISGKPSIGAYAFFKVKMTETILAKAGTSFTSIEEARANLDAEIPHWDFEKTKAEAEHAWNEALSVVHLEGGTKEDYTKFYTSLYRSLLFPGTYSDVDGSYPALDGTKTPRKIENGHIYYNDFSLNDKPQAQLSLVGLVAPDKYEDILKSSKLKAEQGGWLPDSILKNSSVPYQYLNSGDPVERQKKVKDILKKEYTCYDGGIPGNDNSGQKSAWYVFSALGLYPGSAQPGEYQLSSPIFGEVEFNLNPKYYPGGKFTIKIDGQDTYKTFGKVELNGNSIPFVLKQEDLRKGGKLKFSN